jgi:hypothetical protein
MSGAKLKKETPAKPGGEQGLKYEIGVSNERAVTVLLISRGSLGAPEKTVFDVGYFPPNTPLGE